MIIKSLSMTNLRSHRLTELNGFEKINFFIGQNYSGKSTILDALCYGLKAVCRGTDEGGRGADKLVSADGNGRPLAKSFTVKVETDLGIIERTGPGDGPRSGVQTAVDGLLNRASGRLVDPRLLVQSTWFFMLTDGAQKMVIQRLTAPVIQRADIVAALGDDFKLIEHAWPDQESRTIDDLDGIEKYVRDQRKAVKKEQDFLRPVDLGTYPEAIRKLSGDEAQALADKIQAKLTDLKAQHRAQAGGPEAERRKLADLTAQVETLKMQAAAAPAATLEELDQDILSTNKELEARRQELGKLAVGGVDEAKARLAKLKSAGAKCGECGRLLDEKHKAKIKSDLEKQIAAGEASQAKAAELERTIRKLSAWLDDRQQAKVNLAVAIRAHKAASESLAGAVAARDKQAGVVEALVPAEDGLEGRIKTGEDRLVEIRTYLQSRRLYERQLGQVETVGAKVAMLERLCDALGPKGKVRTEIAAAGGVDFAAAVNEVAVPLGLNVTIEPEPFRILARGRDASLLSTSQQLRLGFALQLAIARITGLGFVCVDNLDWVDKAGRATISKIVRDIPEQVFVCATLAMPDAEYKAPTLPGWGFYLVSGDGDTSSVRRVG